MGKNGVSQILVLPIQLVTLLLNVFKELDKAQLRSSRYRASSAQPPPREHASPLETHLFPSRVIPLTAYASAAARIRPAMRTAP
jgi:hypothetical protein